MLSPKNYKLSYWFMMLCCIVMHIVLPVYATKSKHSETSCICPLQQLCGETSTRNHSSMHQHLEAHVPFRYCKTCKEKKLKTITSLRFHLKQKHGVTDDYDEYIEEDKEEKKLFEWVKQLSYKEKKILKILKNDEPKKTQKRNIAFKSKPTLYQRLVSLYNANIHDVENLAELEQSQPQVSNPLMNFSYPSGQTLQNLNNNPEQYSVEQQTMPQQQTINPITNNIIIGAAIPCYISPIYLLNNMTFYLVHHDQNYQSAMLVQPIILPQIQQNNPPTQESPYPDQQNQNDDFLMPN